MKNKLLLLFFLYVSCCGTLLKAQQLTHKHPNRLHIDLIAPFLKQFRASYELKIGSRQSLTLKAGYRWYFIGSKAQVGIIQNYYWERSVSTTDWIFFIPVESGPSKSYINNTKPLPNYGEGLAYYSIPLTLTHRWYRSTHNKNIQFYFEAGANLCIYRMLRLQDYNKIIETKRHTRVEGLPPIGGSITETTDRHYHQIRRGIRQNQLSAGLFGAAGVRWEFAKRWNFDLQLEINPMVLNTTYHKLGNVYNIPLMGAIGYAF